MARWYAKFDSGSAGWRTGLERTGSEAGANFGGFQRLRISTNSASAALLRDGLIASRSAVSADVYDDLDAANRNADTLKGTYFPPDGYTLPSSTLISWSTAYTSSVAFVPTVNLYGFGVETERNNSNRPTASALTTQTSLVGAITPADPVQLNYNVYQSASNAVKATVDTFQNGAATAITPYTRPGVSASRTITSLWYDPDFSYFGWDDYTPGTPTIQLPSTESLGTCAGDPGGYSLVVPITYYWKPEYANDLNPDGYMRLQVTIQDVTTPGSQPNNTAFDVYINPTGSGIINGFQAFTRNQTFLANQFDVFGAVLKVTQSFYDPLISGSRGGIANNTQFFIEKQCP